MNIHFTLAALLATVTLTSCKESPSAADAAAEMPPAAAAALPVEAVAAPAAPSGVNGTPVDTCSMLDAAAAAASVGVLFDAPVADRPQGSLLGGCKYMGDRGILMLSARPANEYAATVDYASRNGGAKPVTDLPGTASLTTAGLMLQPADKPYFLVVYPLVGGKFDDTLALQLARQLKL